MIDIQNLLAAAVEFTPMTNLPLLTGWGAGGAFDGNSVGFFNGLFQLTITIGAMLAVFMFIWGGLQMITARDKSGSISKGKSKMTNAIFGLLMLLSTFVVLNTINPQLTSLKLLDGVSPLNAGDTSSPPVVQPTEVINDDVIEHLEDLEDILTDPNLRTYYELIIYFYDEDGNPTDPFQRTSVYRDRPTCNTYRARALSIGNDTTECLHKQNN